MTAWDYGVFDNEPALEVLQCWQEWVESPDAFSYEDAIDNYFDRWGGAVDYGDAVTNMEIIALAGIHLNKGMTLPRRLFRAAEAAINRELQPEELSSWAEPQRRKTVLLEMLKAIGGKRRTPKPSRSLSDPAIHYPDSDTAERELMIMAEFMQHEGYLGLSSLMYPGQHELLRKHGLADTEDDVIAPPFLQSLYRLMNHRIWEKDWNISSAAATERRMMLAWYLAVSCMMTLDETRELIERAKRRGY